MRTAGFPLSNSFRTWCRGDRNLARRSDPTPQKPRKTAARVSRETTAPPGPVAAAPADSRGSRPFLQRFGTVLAVAGLLVIHLALAERSLVQENPTVDEVVHLPAGVTYWQKGTFRLYHHNPPLVRMVAALPVIWANPVTAPVYEQESWRLLGRVDLGGQPPRSTRPDNFPRARSACCRPRTDGS